MKPEDPDNPILEVSKPTLNINGDENLEEIYSQKNGTLERNAGEGKIQPMALGPARSTSRNSFVMKLVWSHILISFKGIMMDNIEITGFELLLTAYHKKLTNPSLKPTKPRPEPKTLDQKYNQSDAVYKNLTRYHSQNFAKSLISINSTYILK